MNNNFWVSVTLNKWLTWVWKDKADKPFEFVSEIQARELFEVWSKNLGNNDPKYSVIPARSIPLN